MTTGEYLWGKNKVLQSEITSEMLANTGYHGREKYTSLEVVIFLKHFLSLAFEEGELLAQTRHFAFRALSPSLLGSA